LCGTQPRLQNCVSCFQQVTVNNAERQLTIYLTLQGCFMTVTYHETCERYGSTRGPQ
jgi:hypothetical protein